MSSAEANQGERRGGRASDAIKKRQKGLRRAAGGETPQAQPEASPGAAREAEPTEKRIRVTVDLPREKHRALRMLAAEAESTNMGVLAALLEEALDDPDAASRIRERLLKDGE